MIKELYKGSVRETQYAIRLGDGNIYKLYKSKVWANKVLDKMKKYKQNTLANLQRSNYHRVNFLHLYNYFQIDNWRFAKVVEVRLIYGW